MKYESIKKYSQRQQVTCIQGRVTLTTISLPSIVIDQAYDWLKIISLGRPNPKTSLLLGKWGQGFFEYTWNYLRE